MKIPGWLQYRQGENERSRVWFIDTRGTDFSPKDGVWQERINRTIKEILKELPASIWEEPALIKCHIGEPKNITRMLPEFCTSTVRHLQSLGLKRVVCGDTTVAYSGERGHKENPPDNCSRYMVLAKRHGWDTDGPLGIPYVVLDRPTTSVPGILEFNREEAVVERPQPSNPLREIFVADGFTRAGIIINHAHLTLHILSHLAGAVKGLAMGCASNRGKLLIHQFYLPEIIEQTCLMCGECAGVCPEGALPWKEGSPPSLDEKRCIGCGECVAVCPSQSIKMLTREPSDWMKAEGSISYRLTDFLVAMMDGRWDRLLNILHLYNITELCDCINKSQEPIFAQIGFLVGQNPFAVDLMARRLLCEELYPDTLKAFYKADEGEGPFEYAREHYGIVVEPEVISKK